MAFDEALASRLRTRLSSLPRVEEKRMMGGLCFMVEGKMALGIMKDELMVRIDPARHEALVERPGARTMELGKRPMHGYLLVEPDALRTARDLEEWVQQALDFNPRAKASKKR